MKKLLFLLLFPSLVHAQHTFVNRFVWGNGEYVSSFIDRTTGALWRFEGVPSLMISSGMWKVSGGSHSSLALDSLGNVSAWGLDNSAGQQGNGGTTANNTPTPITVDSLGNPFNNVVDIMSGGNGGGWMSGALKGDGTVWIWGSTNQGCRGNGTAGGVAYRPVQVPFPTGTFITRVIINELCIALDNAGNVWTWGAAGVGGGFWTPYILAQGGASNTNTPTKITLPAPAVMIAGGGELMNYAYLNTGRLYCWGYDLNFCGMKLGTSLGSFGMNPTDCTDSLGFATGSIDTIKTNSNSTAAIIHTGSKYQLWAWGDNACGGMGNGAGLDFRHYHVGNVPSGAIAYWAWDQGRQNSAGGGGEAPQVKPIQVCVGIDNFTNIYANNNYNFGWRASTKGDTTLTWGRNKYQVIDPAITNVNGNIGSKYPNNFDVNFPHLLFPFRITSVVSITGRICKDSAAATYCSLYPWDGSKPGPTASPGANQTITTSYTTLNGVCTIGAGVLGRLYPLWTQLSGPSTAIIPYRASDTTPVSGLISGTYTFKYWVEDANFKADSAIMTVTVTSGCGNCIQLPFPLKFVKNEKAPVPIIDLFFSRRRRANTKDVLSTASV